MSNVVTNKLPIKALQTVWAAIQGVNQGLKTWTQFKTMYNQITATGGNFLQAIHDMDNMGEVARQTVLDVGRQVGQSVADTARGVARTFSEAGLGSEGDTLANPRQRLRRGDQIVPFGQDDTDITEFDMDVEDQLGTVQPATTAPGGNPFSTQAALQGVSAGTQTGKATTHGETGIMPWARPKKHPFTEYQNTILTFSRQGSFQINTTTSSATQGQQVLKFRLNSIYDCYLETVTAANELLPPVADQPDAIGIRQVPPMRGYWASKYNYWTVLGCRYKMKLWSTKIPADTGVSPIQAWSVWTYHHGVEHPPETAPGTTVVTDFMRRTFHRHCHQEIYTPPPQDKSQSNVRENMLIINGASKIGQVHHEIVEDELAQTWHRVAEVPPSREIVTFIFNKTDQSFADTRVEDFNYEMEIEYMTQWKDLKRKYQYPTVDINDDATPTIYSNLTL